jgi:hypothetical protein
MKSMIFSKKSFPCPTPDLSCNTAEKENRNMWTNGLIFCKNKLAVIRP